MLKHVGRMANNKRKVIVAYKVVPGEAENCIVVTTENLMAEEHDSLMKLVESPAGQEAEDLATAMQRSVLPDGRNMLAAFHTTGKMVKVPTEKVEMTPTNKTVILLSELNEAIAQQRGVTVEDLAVKGRSTSTQTTAPTKEVVEDTVDSGVLTDEQLAAQYRSDADRLFKEAKRLREQAEELAPTKKATKKTVESDG
jgi:hypothetical protein